MYKNVKSAKQIIYIGKNIVSVAISDKLASRASLCDCLLKPSLLPAMKRENHHVLATFKSSGKLPFPECNSTMTPGLMTIAIG